MITFNVVYYLDNINFDVAMKINTINILVIVTHNYSYTYSYVDTIIYD